MAISTFGGEFAFLSNFHPSLITFTTLEVELVAPTVEHAFQACKATTIEDACLVVSRMTPGQAKREGRKIEVRENWDDIRVSIMLWLLRKKFAIPELREKLLATEDRKLVEGNNWGDTFWGVCNGVGTNMLGVLLMQVRTEILQKEIFHETA